MTRISPARAPIAARRARGASPPIWVTLLGVYILSRVATTLAMSAVYWLARTSGWTFASFDSTPTLEGFLESWDGLYYRQIALDGYPTELPLDATGEVAKNPWAFLPVFPMLVRALVAVTGLDFALCGALVAGFFGAAATLMLYRLLLVRVGATTAFWGAVLFCFSPLSFMLQTAYAESVFLFFMFASVWAMTTRRYVAMAPLGVLAAFSHPGALALAAALGLHVLLRLAQRDRFRAGEFVAAVTTGLVIAGAGFAWPFIATAVTGRSDAYFDTELAWWQDYIGRVEFVPFSPWFLFAHEYLGAVGVVLVLVVVGTSAWLLARRSSRVFGVDIQLYSASYVAYLVAVFLPQQSIFRMLLPLSPLLGHPALSRSRGVRWTMLTASILLQPVIILLLWFVWPP